MIYREKLVISQENFDHMIKSSGEDAQYVKEEVTRKLICGIVNKIPLEDLRKIFNICILDTNDLEAFYHECRNYYRLRPNDNMYCDHRFDELRNLNQIEIMVETKN